jgi:D-arabinitol 4-dehydrogenase
MPTILHLGLGAFHRAHQAVYMQALHDRGDLRWTIASGNIRADTGDAAPALQAQDHAYTLETVSPDGLYRYQRITAVARALPFVPGLGELIALGTAADTRIISFTVTEAGYGADQCSTLYGVLAQILAARRAMGSGPVTLLCCDNLRHNGKQVSAGLQAYLRSAGEHDLAAWVQANTRCPNSMVDRITPRATPALAERVKAATGMMDAVAVSSEAYLQWVIEDDFCNGRPDWGSVGVELVDSVVPYEEAKIRILNASHSCAAWAGTLAGYTHIHQCMADPWIRGLVDDYVTGAVFDCLQPSPIDLAAYRDMVIERFASDAVQDTVERVLADSAAKLSGFIVPTLRERVARALPLEAVAMLPALYIEVFGEAQLDPFCMQDPQARAAIATARATIASRPFSAQSSI